MSGSCETVRLALGAYALGALEPAERDQVEGHLRGCAGCREELAALAVLPEMLRQVGPEEISAADPAGGGALLERTLAELVRRRRRGRLRLRLAGVGAAVAVAAAVLVTVAVRPPASPLSGATVAAHVQGANSATGVQASADVYRESWGSSIQLDVSGVSSGEQCELVTVAADGAQEVAGTWSVGYSGEVDIDGVSGMAPGQIASLRVVTTSGSLLVSLPMPGIAAAR